jgi:hypothetical protein
MAKRKSSSERVPRPGAEIKPNPESEKELSEREAIAEREKLLDELALLRSGGSHQASQGTKDETRKLVFHSGEPFNLE